MRKNRIITMSLREIKKSLKRFFSLCILSFLGVSFFVGMKMSGPTMLKSLDKYYDDNRVYDLKVMSSLGLDDDDLSEIKKLDNNYEVVGSHTKDVLFFDGKYESVLRIHEINKDINNITITEGRMPTKPSEILVEDGIIIKTNIKIGDKITLHLEEDDTSLKTTELEIVGIVLSPEYVNKTEVSQSRGNSTLGNGQVAYYSYALSDLFDMDYYSEIYILDNETTDLRTNTKKYLDIIEEDENKLASIKENRQNERYIRIIEESTNKVNEQEKEANEEFARVQTELDNAKVELDNAKKELDKGKSELDKNKKTLDKAKKDIDKAYNQINSTKLTLAQGLTDLNNGKKEIENKISSYNITYDKLSNFVNKYDSSSFSISDIIKIFSDNNIDITRAIENSSVNIKLLASAYGIDLNSLFYKYGISTDILNNNYIKLDEVIDSATINQIKKLIFDDNFIILVRESISPSTPYYNDIKNYLNLYIDNNENILKLFDSVRKIDNGYSEYYKNLNLVNSKEVELNNSKVQYEEGLSKYNESLATYNSSYELYSSSLNEYNTKSKEFEDKKIEVKEKIELAREKIKKIEKATWFIQSREDNNEYLTYISSYDSINNLSNLFPVIFFIVSVMISLLSMARMAIENRSEIGTLKALGFSNFEVRLKFVIYAMSATLIGGIIGSFIGYKFIPKIVIGIFNIMHNVPYFIYDTNHTPIILGIFISLLCIVGSTIITINNLVREKTTELLRPIAPPIGKKILVEKISFIWNKLNYSNKLTIRNIFRYKRRIFMSIFGIASCTMILLSGYGIKDSISFVVDRQYNSINHNDELISLDGKLSEEELNEYINNEVLDFNVYAKIDQVEINNKRVSLIVPNDYEEFKKTLTIRDIKTKEEITLTDNTVVVTQKLAKFLKKKVGDTITILESDNLPYDFKITNITENYIGDYVYFNKHMYTKYIDEYKITTQYIKFKDVNKENEIMTELREKNTHILSTVSIAAVKAQCVELFKSLSIIVYVLVLFTAVLSFVVFYSLAYINISERQREIATIKVLGYYNREVDNYIMKEEFIITVLGILVGLLVGTYYAYAMIDSIEINTMQYIKEIQLSSYLQTFGFMLIFTAIVSIGVHFKLKKIDLIESLKSVE